METTKAPDGVRSDMANLGKGLSIRGELSGSEDLYIDGQLEGAIELVGSSLVVGPNGRIKANVNARSAVIQGKVEGNIRATERVDLKQSAVVLGDIAAQRISIEEGAYFKGGVDIQKDGARSEAKAAGISPGRAASPVGAAALEPRKS
jgi:cytoskeletal protein CcmA (bactofilin family)